MKAIADQVTTWILALITLVKTAWLQEPAFEKERGDVPGWVMITMMTAILVAGLLIVAQDALINMFNDAMSRIGG